MAEHGLSAVLAQGVAAEPHRPWPRLRVSPEGWSRAVELLARGACTLVSLWGDTAEVHLALLDEKTGTLAVVSVDAARGRFPSVARTFPPAARLERAIHDLFGLEPEEAADARPWLDHGRWGLRAPLGAGSAVPLVPRASAQAVPLVPRASAQAVPLVPRASAQAVPLVPRASARNVPQAAAADYPFLAAEGESLHQVPVGPVHAGTIEPGHFRFTANGEAVVRLEERLGYAHKGTEALMRGADLARAARLAGRVSGDSTVAYALAFARAVEAAAGAEVPARAVWLRALLAELERAANHLGDIGAICNDAAFAMIHAHCAILREEVLRASADCFGHRLMMDCIRPGGVAVDLEPQGAERLHGLVRLVRRRFPAIVTLYDDAASLQDRTVGTGILKPELARQFGCGGFIGRASGRDFDARRNLAYPPYDQLRFVLPARKDGDVNARIWVRVREVEQSLAMVEQILAALPAGATQAPVPSLAAEGAAIVESFRGDVFVWVRIGRDGSVERCHLRDPSWFQWPVLEAVIEGNIVADFPLCNKSFNCSYSGHDL
ncbi:MAG: NADH-quinone oxidoreductase subunit C [SAR324 cluster bacterium]